MPHGAVPPPRPPLCTAAAIAVTKWRLDSQPPLPQKERPHDLTARPALAHGGCHLGNKMALGQPGLLVVSEQLHRALHHRRRKRGNRSGDDVGGPSTEAASRLLSHVRPAVRRRSAAAAASVAATAGGGILSGGAVAAGRMRRVAAAAATLAAAPAPAPPTPAVGIAAAAVASSAECGPRGLVGEPGRCGCGARGPRIGCGGRGRGCGGGGRGGGGAVDVSEEPSTAGLKARVVDGADGDGAHRSACARDSWGADVCVWERSVGCGSENGGGWTSGLDGDDGNGARRNASTRKAGAGDGCAVRHVWDARDAWDEWGG
eukprot:364335-Chlamydomonas_euryale.AAC.7